MIGSRQVPISPVLGGTGGEFLTATQTSLQAAETVTTSAGIKNKVIGQTIFLDDILLVVDANGDEVVVAINDWGACDPLDVVDIAEGDAIDFMTDELETPIKLTLSRVMTFDAINAKITRRKNYVTIGPNGRIIKIEEDLTDEDMISSQTCT